jgi:multicomponent Na+:H+ antiporter subunit G
VIVEVLSYVTAILLIAGSLFGLLAAIGILRLPDLYTRMHAASKAGAVGSGLIFAAVAVISFDVPIALRAIIGIAFVVLTTPVSAHLLARASLKAGYPPSALTAVNELDVEGKSQP